MSVSQQAIAKRLGLSTATISRSLSGHPRISPKTKARVLNTAQAMGYDFDADAFGSISDGTESASGGRSARRAPSAHQGVPLKPSDGAAVSVSVLSYGKPSVSGYASVVRNRILSGMIEECRGRGLTLSLDYIDEKDADRLADPDMLPAAIRSGQSQGVLITGHFPDQAVAQLCNQLPCVQVADYCPSRSLDCIDHDDMRSVELLVDHLWSLGHRKIGYVGGEVGHIVDLIRGNALALAMLRRGVDRASLNERCRDVLGPADRPEAAFGWVRDAIAQGVTGWVATNDAVGYRLLEYLAQHGIHCPRDLSLGGFDHFDPPAGLPKLTSIDAPFEDMGRLAVVRLHQRIRQTVSSTHHTMIECRLKVGASTAPVSN